MSYINTVTLLGNMVRDPELSYTPNGKAVCKFALAVSNKYKDKDKKEVDKPLFVDIVVWNKQAESTAQYMRKGSPILIVGRMVLDQWEDDAGQRHYKHKVVARQVIFIGGKKNDIQDTGPGGAVPESEEASQPPLEENQ